MTTGLDYGTGKRATRDEFKRAARSRKWLFAIPLAKLETSRQADLKARRAAVCEIARQAKAQAEREWRIRTPLVSSKAKLQANREADQQAREAAREVERQAKVQAEREWYIRNRHWIEAPNGRLK